MLSLSQGTVMPSDHDSPVGLEVDGYEQTNDGRTPQMQDSDGVQKMQPARRQATRNKYICSLCGQSFIRGEHLRRHEQSHGKEKPYKCRRCQSKFARRDTMLRHIRNFHPDLENPSHSVMDVEVPSPNSSLQSVNTDITEASEPQSAGERSDIGAVDSFMAVGAGHHLAPVGGDQVLGGFYDNVNLQQVHNPSNIDASQDLTFTNSVENGYRPSNMETANVPARPENFDAPQPDVSSGAYLPEESLWFPDGELSMSDINDLAMMFSPNMGLPSPGRHMSSMNFSGEQSDPLFSAPHASQSMGFSEEEEYLHAVMATTDKTYNAANSPVVTDSEASACVEMINLFSSLHLPLSKNMINRYFKAYVQYFDPHTPIVHLAAFKIDNAPVSLTLAMLTIGALYASEPDRAAALYSMASECVEQTERQWALLDVHGKDPSVVVGAIQSRVLLAQYALCSNKSTLIDAGLIHLLKAESNFRSGIPSGHADDEWTSWIYAESFRRAELWTLVLCAAFGSDGQVPVHLPSLGDINHQLPCSQELWTESSKDGWLTATAKAAKSLNCPTFASSLATLLQGGPLTEEVSPFGTLVLISGLLTYILTLERTTSLNSNNTRSHWVPSAEKSLKAWEKTWKNHSQGPTHSPRGKNEHLLADCVPLFLTACYHTYASRLLKDLKASLGLKMLSELSPDNPPTGNSMRGYVISTVKNAISWKSWEQLLAPQSESEWNDLTQAVRLAAGYILVRAKQGFRNVARTAPLEMGFHNVLSGFEGALLVSCWVFAASSDGRSDSNALLLHRIVQDVIREMDEQMCPEVQVKKYPAIASLAGLQSMMSQGWIWSLAHRRAEQLQLHETRLIAALDQREQTRN